MLTKKTTIVQLLAASAALAARPFLDSPDTGLLDVFGDVAAGDLPDLDSIAGLPDFQWAAQNSMSLEGYTYYRGGSGGEWSYRNNLEVFARYSLRPRRMRDVTGVPDTLPTTILGYNFSAPFFISPAARAGYAHESAELNLVKAAAEEDILYIPSLKATLTVEEIAAAKADGQVTFQQLYLDDDGTVSQDTIDRIEDSGAKAIVLTVDAATDGDRQRAFRLRGGIPDAVFVPLTWDTYKTITNMTSLPVLLKGILTIEDAQDAVDNGVPGIMLSNHGGRNLDGTPSTLEVALDIHQNAPELFDQIEIYADGGVRYGTDVLKLLALGVKAVGVARPFMFANVYGMEGVQTAIQILKREIAVDAANLGVADLARITADYVNWTPNGWLA